jgi:hypothetical protein
MQVLCIYSASDASHWHCTYFCIAIAGVVAHYTVLKADWSSVVNGHGQYLLITVNGHF